MDDFLDFIGAYDYEPVEVDPEEDGPCCRDFHCPCGG